MNVVLLCGSHPRHLHVAHALADAGRLSGIVVESRGALIPTPPDGITAHDRALFVEHFERRAVAEGASFGSVEPEDLGVPVRRVERRELNDAATVRFVSERAEADVMLSYGVHKIDDAVLDEVRRRGMAAWNIHGGLSPWYRGTATLFWPFYFLQPNWTGMTVHELTSAIDGGHVVHQSRPDLRRGDGIHDVGARAVLATTADLLELLAVEDESAIARAPQRSAGRIFRDADWHPGMLRLVYDAYDDRIVDAWLDGDLSHAEPRVHRWNG